MNRKMMRRLGMAMVAWWGFSLMASYAQDSLRQEPLLREMVTLNYDKTKGCDLGDTIHFDAFVTREGKEGATDYSRVLYVELLLPNGGVIQRRKLALTNGRARGAVWVDSIYGSGFYELRAYTRYMTNWRDERYFSRLVPVFLPLGHDGKEPKEGVRSLNVQFPRTENEWIRSRRLRQDTVYTMRQPIETNLMLFGHIEPRLKEPTAEDSLLGDRKLKVLVQQGEKMLSGDMETDDFGRFGLYFPDMKGEWNLVVVSPKGKEPGKRSVTHRHFVMLDRLFAPSPRYFPASDLEPQHYGWRKWKDDRSQRDERTGRFIDCDLSTTSMKNAGHVSLGFYHFLGMKDRQFERTTGLASPTVLNVARDTSYHKFWDINLFKKTSDDPHTVCVDGPSYRGRPIVWIVNGAYRLVTGLKKHITDFEVLRPTDKSMPIYADEVRHVYISPNPDAFRPYVRCSVLEKKHPITVFITTHPHYIWNDSGLYSTYFEGFDE
ncbi:MAG: hypothetical protein IJR02_03890 [Bacteroidaceae bacterium]|nr:hypothetical protein [Bacteroidaceae bacterium]